MNVQFMYGVTLLDIVALSWFLLAWVGYTSWADRFSQTRPSLMTVMYDYRLEWMKQALHREVRVADAALLSTLIRSISLFASTAIFLLGGLWQFLGHWNKYRI